MLAGTAVGLMGSADGGGGSTTDPVEARPSRLLVGPRQRFNVGNQPPSGRSRPTEEEDIRGKYTESKTLQKAAPLLDTRSLTRHVQTSQSVHRVWSGGSLQWSHDGGPLACVRDRHNDTKTEASYEATRVSLHLNGGGAIPVNQRN